MVHELVNGLGRCDAGLLGAGFVSNSYGVAPGEAGLGEVLALTLLGGFCGLICGLIVTQVMRYLAFVTGKNLGNHVWTLAGAVLGAAVFAALALSGPAK